MRFQIAEKEILRANRRVCAYGGSACAANTADHAAKKTSAALRKNEAAWRKSRSANLNADCDPPKTWKYLSKTVLRERVAKDLAKNLAWY